MTPNLGESRNYPEPLAPPAGVAGEQYSPAQADFVGRASSLRLRWQASEAGRNLRRTATSDARFRKTFEA